MPSLPTAITYVPDSSSASDTGESVTSRTAMIVPLRLMNGSVSTITHLTEPEPCIFSRVPNARTSPFAYSTNPLRTGDELPPARGAPDEDVGALEVDVGAIPWPPRLVVVPDWDTAQPAETPAKTKNASATKTCGDVLMS